MEPRITHARKEYAWYDAAVAAGVPEPEAMTLSTATPDGRPSARIVLLRGFDARGFCFFTNYDSRKGRELMANPHASLTFHWADLERQVRIEGLVEQTTAAESDEYFRTRPSTSRIGAWSSPQSEVIPDRAALEALFTRYREQHPDDTAIPRPPNWGGFRLVPARIEFWQGRPSRLHDRLCFRRESGGAWMLERLAP
jgi:pyridoxamine 5'-phosphate oxidase